MPQRLFKDPFITNLIAKFIKLNEFIAPVVEDATDLAAFLDMVPTYYLGIFFLNTNLPSSFFFASTE